MRGTVSVVVAIWLAVAGYLGYRNDERIRTWVDAKLTTEEVAPKKKSQPPAPVRTASVRKRDVPMVLEGVGNVQARSTVAIKSRIDGQLLEAAVNDGQFVRKGDLLFKLDARPLAAELQQAEANLARDKANLEKARKDMARADGLARKGYSPQTRLEDAETNVAAIAATIRASEANVEIARLNLEYATIKAPLDGRAGSVLVSPGNMIKANDTQALLVITEVRPINVVFALPEQYVGEITSRMASGKPLPVSVYLQGDGKLAEDGILYFIDNAVDTSTGTIQVMARFANTEGRLVPGQFVKAQVTLTTLPDAIVVPSKAIQINQKGQYVWVTKPEGTVAPRPVKTGPSIGGDTVVTEGLEADEEVVTDGQLRLFPGAKIAPVKPEGDKPRSKKAQS